MSYFTVLNTFEKKLVIDFQLEGRSFRSNPLEMVLVTLDTVSSVVLSVMDEIYSKDAEIDPKAIPITSVTFVTPFTEPPASESISPINFAVSPR